MFSPLHILLNRRLQCDSLLKHPKAFYSLAYAFVSSMTLGTGANDNECSAANPSTIDLALAIRSLMGFIGAATFSSATTVL